MIEIQLSECNLRNMHWDSVSDWSRLCPSKITMFGEQYVTREDIMRFYKMVVKDIARKVSQDYEKVREIIDEENTPFIEYVDQIFKNKKRYLRNARQILQLREMLLVPQTDATYGCMVKLYHSLNPNQKEEFKKRIMES